MTPLEKVRKARAGLVLDMPFFGALALRLLLKEDPSAPTAWVDGITLGFNPKFVESLSLDELKGLICHEVLHCANEHHLRRQERNFEKWNMACDYAINSILEDSGIHLPAGRLRDPNYDGKSAEEIYRLLPDPSTSDINGNGGQSNKGSSTGEVRDLPSKSESAIQASADEWKIATAQAANVAKQAGNVPAGLKRLVEEIVNPRLDYRVILDRFTKRVVRDNYVWFPPNRKLLSMGYFPGMRSETIGKLAIVLDTSGSVTNRMLAEYQADLQYVMETCNTELVVLYVDSVLYEDKIQRFFPGDQVVLDPKGGGGTSYKPAFEYLRNSSEDFVGVLYFTDGYCWDFPDNVLEIPVLWIVPEKNFNPPFGEVALVNT